MQIQNPNFFLLKDAHTDGQAETNMLATFSKLGAYYIYLLDTRHMDFTTRYIYRWTGFLKIKI